MTSLTRFDRRVDLPLPCNPMTPITVKSVCSVKNSCTGPGLNSKFSSISLMAASFIWGYGASSACKLELVETLGVLSPGPLGISVLDLKFSTFPYIWQNFYNTFLNVRDEWEVIYPFSKLLKTDKEKGKSLITRLFFHHIIWCM